MYENNNNVKYYQNQYEQVILNKLDNEIKTGFNEKMRLNESSARTNIIKDIEDLSNSDIKKGDKNLEDTAIHQKVEEVNKLYLKDFSYQTQLKIAKGKKVRSLRNKFFNQGKKNYTNMDFDCMTIEDRLVKDGRNFIEYFCESMNEYNAISYAFIKKSILIPQFYRITCFFQYANLYFLLNAMFFFEEYIILRQKPENQVL